MSQLLSSCKKTFNGSSSPRKNLSDNGLVIILLMSAIKIFIDMERDIYVGYIKGFRVCFFLLNSL